MPKILQGSALSWLSLQRADIRSEKNRKNVPSFREGSCVTEKTVQVSTTLSSLWSQTLAHNNLSDSNLSPLMANT